jgi:hypothetical protein
MHAMAAVGNYLYICGGLGGTLLSGSLLRDMWVYDVYGNVSEHSTDSISNEIAFAGRWAIRKSAELPVRISQHTMVSTPDGKLWVFGGQTTGEQVLDRFMSLDATNSSAMWKQYSWNASNTTNSTLRVVAMPAARRFHGMTAVRQQMYVSCFHLHVCDAPMVH